MEVVVVVVVVVVAGLFGYFVVLGVGGGSAIVVFVFAGGTGVLSNARGGKINDAVVSNTVSDSKIIMTLAVACGVRIGSSLRRPIEVVIVVHGSKHSCAVVSGTIDIISELLKFLV